MEKFNPSYVGLRKDILKHIKGNDLVVLDVGCASGENGRYLKDRELAKKVIGIEFNKKMAEEAEDKLDEVFIADLNDHILRKKIINKLPEFDYIIFGDILEHLIHPEKVLKEFCSKLKTSGRIIISLPNIAHIELFLQIYFKGSWPRNPRGIFDSTHLRWFTKKDSINMVKEAGLKLEILERNFRARDQIGSKFNWFYNILKWLNKDLVTFQYLLVATK